MIENARAQIALRAGKLFLQLRHEKTDRETLGDMFSELGLRLKGELELPEK